MSRYLDTQKSKGSLTISTERFVPQHYRSFIFKKDSLDGSTSGKHVAVLGKEELIQLPRIMKKDRSQTVLESERSQTLDL